MTYRKPTLRACIIALAAVAVAGCETNPMSGGATGPSAAAPAAPAAPPVAMAGRWTLASPGKGQCSMTFGAANPAAPEGTIAPAGGCPGQFFTSRKWSYDSSGLLISNHNSEPLARLSAAGGGFNGQATGGDPVTLSR